MTIAICHLCRNTGAVGERYCECPAAVALRARIDADPRIQELRRKIDELLGGADHTVLVTDHDFRVLHPLGNGKRGSA